MRTNFAGGHGVREYVTNFADEAKMLTHCVPIFFLPSRTSLLSTISGNGTAALIDTGVRRILVTCAHVWSGFLDFRQKNSEAVLSTFFRYEQGPLTGLLDAALIDWDERLDLAVFAVEFPDEILGDKKFYRLRAFPVADPRVRQPISFIGFPGEARLVSNTRVRFGYASFGLTVSDVSDSLIVLANNDPRLLRDGAGDTTSPIDIGGMSGAPAYARTPSGGFNLVGFVRAGNTSNTDIRLSKACFLRADGSLFRPAWHPTPSI